MLRELARPAFLISYKTAGDYALGIPTLRLAVLVLTQTIPALAAILHFRLLSKQSEWYTDR